MKSLSAFALVVIGLALWGCDSGGIYSGRTAAQWIENPGQVKDCWYLDDCSIVIKVRDADATAGGGPGGCQPGIEYGAYVIHTLWTIKRKITWQLDTNAKQTFMFAAQDGIYIDRNADTKGSIAFVEGSRIADDTYTFISTGKITLPASNAQAPGFSVNLVRKGGGLACGPADPPIVNQP